MAQVHNELRRGVLSEAIKRLLGYTRSEGGVERFGETLVPILNPFQLPEWQFLRDCQLFSSPRTSAQAAGFISRHGLTNPAGSGVIAVATCITVTNGSASTTGGAIRLNPTVPIVLNPQTIGCNDSRFIPGTRLTVLSSVTDNTQASFAASQTIDTFSIQAGDSFQWRGSPIIVSPGFTVFTDPAGVVNTNHSSTFHGYVRKAYPGELV